MIEMQIDEIFSIAMIRVYTFNLFISNVCIIIILYWRLHDMLNVYLTRLFFLALIVWTVHESPIFVETKQRRSLKQQCAYMYIPAEEIFSCRTLYQSLFSSEIVTNLSREQWNNYAVQTMFNLSCTAEWFCLVLNKIYSLELIKMASFNIFKSTSSTQSMRRFLSSLYYGINCNQRHHLIVRNMGQLMLFKLLR